MKRIILMLLAGSMSVHLGCGSPNPRAFNQARGASSWSALEVRDGLDHERAWGSVFDLIARNFDIDKVFREDGYLQTDWKHDWSGQYLPNYRVRVTIKFSADKKVLQFKPEAQAFNGTSWVSGVDSRLVSTLKTDLMGTVGRIAR
jgi:hypothetical protein